MVFCFWGLVVLFEDDECGVGIIFEVFLVLSGSVVVLIWVYSREGKLWGRWFRYIFRVFVGWIFCLEVVVKTRGF